MKKIFHAGNLVLMGFGAMVLFMCYLVYQCTQNPSVMVTQKYYEQELTFQDKIDATYNGSTIDEFLKFQKNDQDLCFIINDSVNNTIEHLSVDFYNMADDTKDKNMGLTKNLDGKYVIPLEKGDHGNYKIKFNFNTSDKKYYKEYSVNL